MLFKENDQKMFGKWYGHNDLVHCDEFWDDVLKYYQEENVFMFVTLNSKSVEMFKEGFKCDVGTCGECCNKYAYTLIKDHEIKRISESSHRNAKLLQDHVQEANGHKWIYGPCPFLQDNKCSIYDIRPDVCYFYPIQVEVKCEAMIDGKKQEMMYVKVKCKPSVVAIRKVFERLLSKDESLILLPNLNVVKREVGYGSDTVAN